MAIYLATVRKTIAAFGSLFNDISINRFSSPSGEGVSTRIIKVPLSYAPSDKFLRILSETEREGDKVRLKYTLPRMSFELRGLRYDSNRKLQTLNSTCPTKVTTGDIVQYFRQLNPVPYEYDFQLTIAAKQTEDILQIIEQIFPHFAPSYNLTIKDVEKLGITRDVPIIIDNITQEDNFDGLFTENRVIVWKISFKVLGYLYPQITDAEVIKRVTTTIYNNEKSEDTKSLEVNVEINPFDAEIDEAWDINTTIQDFNVT